jgi:copper chaperone
MAMIKLKIDGMTCGHCANAVKSALAQVPGVRRVTEVNIERGEAIIEGDADMGTLISAVQAEGYEARAA